MASTNKFQGLARGPIDHKSSSVINAISDGQIDMGSVIVLTSIINPKETLPRVKQTAIESNTLAYGIAVGGDADGVYGDGSASTDDSTRATTGAGQGVVIVTQGRCLARVNGTVVIGDALTTTSTAGGALRKMVGVETAIAVALNDVDGNDLDMIPVDVQHRGAI